MDFIRVESASVAGIAWAAGYLWIQYRDASVYSCKASEAEYNYLMAAPSKGSHLHIHFKERLRKVQDLGKMLDDPLAEPAQLNTHVPDTCCSKPLSKALSGGLLAGKDSWDCPKCGVSWKARMVQAVRHWEPVAMFEVLPMPRR